MDSIPEKDNPCEELKGVYDAVSLGLKWIQKGFKLDTVDAITQTFRIATCELCPKFDQKDRRCLECCCPMDFKTTLKYDPIKSGAMLQKTVVKCPLSKW